MECVRLNIYIYKLALFGWGETNSPSWSWMLATQVTDIHFGVILYERKNILILETWQYPPP